MPGSGDARANRGLQILVATEDGSRDATKVVQQVARRVLQSVLDHPSQLVRWVPIEAEHHPVVNAMRWKSRSSADMPAVRDLHRRLATHLAQGPDSFVFFHFDADAKWSERPSANLDAFDSRVRSGVRQVLQQPRRGGVAGETPDQALERLIPLVPYFEMEAWTLQNTTVAVRIAREKYGGRDVARFEAFAAARQDVDEDENVASTVLGKKHNLELTEVGYPFDGVLRAGTSLAAVRNALRDCRALISALSSLPTS